MAGRMQSFHLPSLWLSWVHSIQHEGVTWELFKLAPPPGEHESLEAHTIVLFTWTAAAIRKTNGRSSSVQVVYSLVCGLRNLQHLTHNGGQRDRKSPFTRGEWQVGLVWCGLRYDCTCCAPSTFLWLFLVTLLFVIHTIKSCPSSTGWFPLYILLSGLHWTAQSQFRKLVSSLKKNKNLRGGCCFFRRSIKALSFFCFFGLRFCSYTSLIPQGNLKQAFDLPATET